jgi:hypothetical protein
VAACTPGSIRATVHLLEIVQPGELDVKARVSLRAAFRKSGFNLDSNRTLVSEKLKKQDLLSGSNFQSLGITLSGY